jgi:hypothetical protein
MDLTPEAKDLKVWLLVAKSFRKTVEKTEGKSVFHKTGNMIA